MVKCLSSKELTFVVYSFTQNLWHASKEDLPISIHSTDLESCLRHAYNFQFLISYKGNFSSCHFKILAGICPFKCRLWWNLHAQQARMQGKLIEYLANICLLA